MAKKQRAKQQANHLAALVTLRDMPGTRIMFWVVENCPYCAAEHLHLAGNLRSADPGDTLGEQKAPCNPEKTYVLTLPPRPQKKKGKRRRTNWEDSNWEDAHWADERDTASSGQEPKLYWLQDNWDDGDDALWDDAKTGISDDE